MTSSWSFILQEFNNSSFTFYLTSAFSLWMQLKSIRHRNADCRKGSEFAVSVEFHIWRSAAELTGFAVPSKHMSRLHSAASPLPVLYTRFLCLSSTFAIQLSSDSPVSNDEFDGPWLSQCHIFNPLYPANIKKDPVIIQPREEPCLWFVG